MSLLKVLRFYWEGCVCVCVSGQDLWVMFAGQSLELLLGYVPDEFIFFFLKPQFPHTNQEDMFSSMGHGKW